MATLIGNDYSGHVQVIRPSLQAIPIEEFLSKSHSSSDRGPDKGALGLRKVLVTFQFVLTIVMIVSTIVIGRQLNFIQNRDIGFNKDRLMVIDINSGDVRRQFQVLKNEYRKIQGVQQISY